MPSSNSTNSTAFSSVRARLAGGGKAAAACSGDEASNQEAHLQEVCLGGMTLHELLHADVD